MIAIGSIVGLATVSSSSSGSLWFRVRMARWFSLRGEPQLTRFESAAGRLRFEEDRSLILRTADPSALRRSWRGRSAGMDRRAMRNRALHDLASRRTAGPSL